MWGATAPCRVGSSHHKPSDQRAGATRILREHPDPPAAPDTLVLSVDGAMIPLGHGQWAKVRTLAVGEVLPLQPTRDGSEVETSNRSSCSRGVDRMTFASGRRDGRWAAAWWRAPTHWFGIGTRRLDRLDPLQKALRELLGVTTGKPAAKRIVRGNAISIKIQWPSIVNNAALDKVEQKCYNCIMT